MERGAAAFVSDTGSPFPNYRVLSEEEARGTQANFALNLGLDRSADALAINLECFRRSSLIGSVHEDQQTLDLVRELSKFSIVPPANVLVDWSQFNPVFEMLVEDASRTFFYLWYPGADDLAVFDASGTWMLLILHYGDVRLWNHFA